MESNYTSFDKNRKEKYLESLPKVFNRQKYLEVAKAFSIPDKTAEGYITEFHKKGLIHREQHDHYLNLTVQACPDPDTSSIGDSQETQDFKEG